MTSLITHADRIRELRACLGQLVEPTARVLPMVPPRRRPDHAKLRQRMPLLRSGSADLIRADRER